MISLSIDFRTIRSFGGSQNHAFEELCAQLAVLEPRVDVDRFHRKGIGGDAGVECYVRHHDGSETGWQAKYFFELDTGQLDKSIDQALAKHPRLTRYIVCIPFDLPDARVGRTQSQLLRWEAWKKKWKIKATRQKRSLSIELWSKSALVERLGRDDPLYSGRAAFWFDATLLTSRWFGDRFEQSRASLGERYSPETHVQLPIRQAILAFCRDPSLLDQVERWGEKLEEARHEVLSDIERLGSAADLTAEKHGLEQSTSALSSLLSGTPSDANWIFPVDELKVKTDAGLIAVGRASRSVWHLQSEDKSIRDHIGYLRRSLSKLEEALDRILTGLNSEPWLIVNSRRVLVTGPAGIGKSHLFGDAVDHQVQQGRPALLILGGTLIDSDIWTQIVHQLGLTISVAAFLGALDAAAEAAGTRAVIFIDAINERHGIVIWSERLAAFLKTIEPFSRVAVALSCRSTYLPFILRNGVDKDLPQLQHVGFAGRAAEAARIYLDRRGIVRMAAPNLVPEFENPLFLKTCCDYLAKEGLHELPRGLRGVTEIFAFYTQAVAKSVELRLGLDRNLGIVVRALKLLSRAFDDGERGWLDYRTAAELLEPLHPSAAQFEKSLLAQLISEGVLAEEPVTDENGKVAQIVRFSFERFSDHRIARQLLDRALDPASPVNSFLPGTPLHTYLTRDQAYEHQGVIEALAIQLPERCGVELPDALPKGTKNRHLAQRAFRDSVLWREQKAVTKRTMELLKEASRFTGRDEVLQTMLAIATEPENIFNAEYLHDRLVKLPMPERDKVWSIYVAQEASEDDSPIETLITWTAQNGFESIAEDRAELAALTLTWLFSTSNRMVRDRATKALAALLAPRLALAAKLVERFQAVNDPYVLERLLAAAYGAALQGLTDDRLGALAETAQRCVFDRDEALVHVLIRDYARGVIELADRRGVLPLAVDIARARPPYRSAWPIEDVSKETVEQYKQDYPGGHRFTDDIVSSAVNDGDFARYVMDHPVREFSSLPITWIGRTEDNIYHSWADALRTSNPEAYSRLEAVVAACEDWRSKQNSRRPLEIVLRFVDPGDPVEEDERNAFDEAIDDAEERLREALGQQGWEGYNDQARHYVRRGLEWARHRYQWPPSFETGKARRWICKRAHDFGWTPERFSEFDRQRGRGGDRYDHQVERIGKKYQWLAFHELLARLGDNVGFIGWSREHGMSEFQGPWQVNRRDIDPSLFVARPLEDKRQSDRTWWMPFQVTLKPMSPHARLSWLEGPEDLINSETLISVINPKDKRTWLVIDEYEGWIQWGMREGDRTIDRQTWLSVKCLLVRPVDRAALIDALSKKHISPSHSGLEIEKPSDGYIGEYPWHPLYNDVSAWIEPNSWNRLGVPVQPTVTEYLAERSGHDYSIEDTFQFNVPGPGLIGGMDLHLSNGRDLTYADKTGTVIFFDPSTKEPGPRAALVDREAFLAFLKRENLEAVWIVSGAKEVHGGRKHREGYGGARSFTSLYWLTDNGFQRRHFERTEKPSKEQLAKFFDEDGVVMPANKPARPARRAKGKKPSMVKKQKARKTKTKRRSKPTRATTPNSKSSAAKMPKGLRRGRKGGAVKNVGLSRKRTR